MEKIIEQVKKNKKVLIGIFLVCVFGYYLIWVITQPFNMAPDEAMKYDICNYLYKNNKLPLGTDEAIRDKLWGISYAFQPILTYMVGAIFMKIMSIFSTEQFALVVAARLVSTLSMTAVIYFVIKISEKLFKGIYKYLFVTMIAFLPLTAFLASYINNDSTAVLATAIIVYCWILGLESNWKNVHCAWLGIGIGFCALTYYNAYGYILCSIIICLATTISDKMKINGMTAEDIDIIARGDVSGKGVNSSNLVIRSNGHTGYEDDPLLIHVSGNVDISSVYGEVHYVNSYRKANPSEDTDKNTGQDQNSAKEPEVKPDKKPQRKPSSGKEDDKKQQGENIPEQKAKGILLPVKTGDSTPTEANLYLALLSLAAVFLLLKEKRRKNR